MRNFGRRNRAPVTARGERIYAIGDVHGCVDLLEDLWARIMAHNATRPPAQTTRFVFLGDIVDRGPDTRGALDWLDRKRHEVPGVMTLLGNHEEMLIRACERDPMSFSNWLRSGGAEAAASFGLPSFDGDDVGDYVERLRAAVTPDRLDWIRAWPLTATSGDYFLCHAGIRPGVALRRQQRRDLLWIREEFLADPRDHGAVIVHGHTISATVEMPGNRIGVDTGAYATGVLSAVYLEADKVEVLATSGTAR
ncbi:serine/threonine protein phosphatase [Sphingomonas sp. NBWT7]|uniref:metallophosphoesterase family protein n=1 Tax=Sphingomonas sp. NBWT7 TaxID=2596913 RepID=UPI001624DE18|nr:metallophosphoesterase family protein [Sphingomonas sp. NBWT7]QNE31049.1 serine/threonine protein phosphatase [Sphingomonas sp. NBWT7]